MGLYRIHGSLGTWTATEDGTPDGEPTKYEDVDIKVRCSQKTAAKITRLRSNYDGGIECDQVTSSGQVIRRNADRYPTEATDYHGMTDREQMIALEAETS